jgi:HEAT repeat protein
MAVTMEQVLELLDADEPDYEFASMLGSGALPHLATLISGDNRAGLASKATYLVGLIEDPHTSAVLAEAITSPDPLVRLAAASTLRNVSASTRDDLAPRLLEDEDLGIRKVTLRSLSHVRAAEWEGQTPKIARRLRAMAEGEPSPELRRIAAQLNEN